MGVPNVVADGNTSDADNDINENMDAITDGSAFTDISNNIVFDNTKGINIDDSAGTPRQVLSMDTSDCFELGRMRRQGGSATAWATTGTTNYTTGDFTIQCGAVSNGGSAATTITFPTAFSYTPIVTANPSGAITGNPLTITAVSTTQVTLNNNNATAINIHWIAMGSI